jgi:hypothetical protein
MHRTRLLFAAALIAALMLPTAALAGSPRDRVTGGGQVLTAGGAGDTIAYSAQQDMAGGFKGQIQYVDRTDGTGQGQQQYHYVVTCLDVEGSTAYIEGTVRGLDPDDATGTETITLYVADNGEGAASEADIVVVNPSGNDSDDNADDNACGDAQASEADMERFGLTRGNAQVYDATPPAES